ncbi:class I SAM-dependent methyltransferase [Hymenobacter sp. ASUV-10]|uniref:Class I SAM-dependent methyltransferase n=1 Tax=Hymenobacter aranciens TaxID=3063996 RepID=A0ABT9BG85_9BACT|nr:class I SAM-dependent methyltransferase [Hymenobacter sp. ASUV-10]MDO7877280.1 class I SAM-dependent methyltransferase [Hymenobacter sp. ASUV-10]
MSTRLNNLRYFLFARVYDLALRRFYQPLVRQLVAAVNAQPGRRVLEVGVGTGISLPFYNAQRKHVTAIDCSAPMLQAAREKSAQFTTLPLDLQEASAEDYASRAADYEQIVFCSVLSVVQEPAQLLQAYYEALRPGGRLYLLNHFTPAHGPLRLADRLLTPIGKILGFRNYFPLSALTAGLQHPEITTLKPGYWSIVQITKPRPLA